VLSVVECYLEEERPKACYVNPGERMNGSSTRNTQELVRRGSEFLASPEDRL
jgi:hypothetical protein